MSLEAASAVPPAAWAYWPRWSGKSVLVPHIARTAVQAATDLLGEESRCSIDVRIPVRPDGHDCEHVDSPEKFQGGISSEALRRFDSVRILARHPKLDIEVVLARAPGFGPKWLDRGVLLEVRAADGSVGPKDVCSVRDRVRGAVDRGSPTLGAKARAFGEGRTPVPRKITRRRAIAFVDEHFGPGAISRLANAIPAPRDGVTASTTAGPGPSADTGADARTRKIDPRLLEIAADPVALRIYRLRIWKPDPDVEDYLLNEHPEWVDEPRSARPGRLLLENLYWIVPIVLAFVSGVASPLWGNIIVSAMAAALVGLFISHYIAKRLFPPVRLTDVGRMRYIVARIATWVVGPGIAVITFLLGRWLR